MWVFSQPKKIRLINNFLQVIFILLNVIFGQKKIDQNFICSQTKSSSRVFSETSSLTEDQGKIDITYYKIDFEIDFNSEQILGSVIANGFAVSPYEPGLMLWWRLGSFTGVKYSSALSSTIPGPSGFGSDEMERNKVA